MPKIEIFFCISFYMKNAAQHTLAIKLSISTISRFCLVHNSPFSRMLYVFRVCSYIKDIFSMRNRIIFFFQFLHNYQCTKVQFLCSLNLMSRRSLCLREFFVILSDLFTLDEFTIQTRTEQQFSDPFFSDFSYRATVARCVSCQNI